MSFPKLPKRIGNKAIVKTRKETELEKRKKEEAVTKPENLYSMRGGGSVFQTKMNVRQKRYKRWSKE